MALYLYGPGSRFDAVLNHYMIAPKGVYPYKPERFLQNNFTVGDGAGVFLSSNASAEHASHTTPVEIS